MRRPVIILHGYSDDHDSFKPLLADLTIERTQDPKTLRLHRAT